MGEGIESSGSGVSDGMSATGIAPPFTGPRCLNCGAWLTGAYCQACGQKAQLHRTVSHFWHDFLHGVLHFDGKLWRTLPMLAWHPGELTRRYSQGERARFVSPLALFLFAVFLSFAAFHNLASDGGISRRPDLEATAEYKALRADLAKIDADIIAARAARQDTAALESKRKELQTALGIVTLVAPGDVPAGNPPMRDRFEAGTNDPDAPLAADLDIEGADKVPLLRSAIDKVRKNPELLLYKVQSYAYKYAWALIPLSALWLWALYAFDRRFVFYDHIVFVTYSIAFMMLFAVLLLVLGAAGIGSGLLIASFVLFAPIHMFRQLRGAYRGGRAASVLRTVLLIMGTLIVLLAFSTMLFALGAS